MMTPRERLIAFLRGEPCDRVPVWLLFPYHRVSYYADVRSLPQYRTIVHAADACQTVWLNRRNLGTPLFTSEVTTVREEVVEGTDTITRTVYAYQGLRLTTEQRHGARGPHYKPLLDSEEDLEVFAKFTIECDDPPHHGRTGPENRRLAP